MEEGWVGASVEMGSEAGWVAEGSEAGWAEEGSVEDLVEEDSEAAMLRQLGEEVKVSKVCTRSSLRRCKGHNRRNIAEAGKWYQG